MLSTILGLKGTMGQSFIDGRRVTLARVLAGPCVVTQVKTMDRDGYWAVQLGLSEKSLKNTTKPLQGHLKKTITGNLAPRFLVEIRLDQEAEFKVGDKINLSDIFSLGDIVAVTGISKGKGFAGGVKRYHFHGGSQTHGQSDRPRAPGAISSGTTPGRVRKGKRMAGRMGGERKTVKNLQVISLNPETREIGLSGPIPGVIGNLVILHKISAGKLKGIQEVVAQVVEGEAEIAPVKEAAANA